MRRGSGSPTVSRWRQLSEPFYNLYRKMHGIFRFIEFCYFSLDFRKSPFIYEYFISSQIIALFSPAKCLQLTGWMQWYCGLQNNSRHPRNTFPCVTLFIYLLSRLSKIWAQNGSQTVRSESMCISSFLSAKCSIPQTAHRIFALCSFVNALPETLMRSISHPEKESAS